MQYFRNLRSQVIAGLTEAIDDFAEVCFVDPQDFRHSVLAETAGVDPQLQIWIEITMNWHCWYPLLLSIRQSLCQSPQSSVFQHFVALRGRESLLKPSDLSSMFPKRRKVSEKLIGFCAWGPDVQKSNPKRTYERSRKLRS